MELVVLAVASTVKAGLAQVMTKLLLELDKVKFKGAWAVTFLDMRKSHIGIKV